MQLLVLSMEIHRIPGHVFSEIVYKDALIVEAKLKSIPFEREKEFKTQTNHIATLLFCGFCFFFDDVIVEINANEDAINAAAISPTLNYLKASGCRVGLIINFGNNSLQHKRLID